MLFKELDKLKRSALMTTIVLVFVGFLFLILPEKFIPFLSDGLAFSLLVALVLSVINFIGSAKAPIHYFYMVAGLAAGGVGIVLYTFENFLLASLSWISGVVPILFGLYGIVHALIFARRSGRKSWWVLILLSALLVLFGTAVFFTPWGQDKQLLLKIVGGTLMFSAIVSGLRMIYLWPVPRNGGEDEQ